MFASDNQYLNYVLTTIRNFNQKERNDFLDKLCQLDQLNENDLECIELHGNDNSKEWQLNDQIEATTNRIPVGYLFIHRPSDYWIHLVLFYSRSGSLWTGKINNTEDTENELTNFKFGLYEELFDDFELTTQNIRMPKDLLVFLMEKNNSR